MKGFRVTIRYKKRLEIVDVKNIWGVENASSIGYNTMSIKFSLYKFYDKNLGLEPIEDQECLKIALEYLLNGLEKLDAGCFEYEITRIEYSFFYEMEYGRNLNSYQYIFKFLSSACTFEAAEGTSNWKIKKLSKAQFGNRKDVSKSTRKLEIYSLSDHLSKQSETLYTELRDKFQIVDQLLVFDVSLSTKGEDRLEQFTLEECRTKALQVLTKYFFSEDVETLYNREVQKITDDILPEVKLEQGTEGFSHKALINKLLRTDELTNFLSYSAAIKKIYDSSDTRKVTVSRCKKIFSEIEDKENLILIEPIKHIQNMVTQIYKN